MAYDVAVADRVRKILKARKGVSERKMFGGITFLLNGNMCCGVVNKDLVLRLGETGASRALKLSHARPMDYTGKPLKSMVYVGPKGFQTDAALRKWVRHAADYARSLPAK